MPLSYAILGLLSHGPKTGYEIKKIMQASSFMYWSASNNQIYSTLTDLRKEAYVTSETIVQESLPPKKRHSITRDGLDALKRWALSRPEQPEMRKGFLIQLACSEQLNNKQLSDLLDAYEGEIKGRMAIESKKISDGAYSPARSTREQVIWKWIYKSHASSFANELLWLAALRAELKDADCSEYEHINESDVAEREIKMFNYRVISNQGSAHIALGPDGRKLGSEQDALDLIALCWENDARKVLISDGALAEDFLRLKTGVAGTILQKFSNYNIKPAIVVSRDRMSDRFKELSYELNSGNLIGVFDSNESAEAWLNAGDGK